MHYSTSERKLATLLSRFPAIKSTLKLLYQHVMYLIFRESKNIYLHDGFRIATPQINPNSGSFFGYYTLIADKNNSLLWHRFPKHLSAITRSNSPIEIMLGNQVIGQTTSWNWQQGSMLHWHDQSTVMWNDYDNTRNHWVTRIYANANDSTKTLPYPCYDSSAETGYIVSLDFQRLARFRPDYGYFNKPTEAVKNLSSSDGLSIYKISTNELKTFIPIDRISAGLYTSGATPSIEKLNHVKFSPDGNSIIFLHRWYDSHNHKFSRLMYYNIPSDSLSQISSSPMISHCCWLNNSQIIGWMRGDNGDHYYMIDLPSGKHNILGEHLLLEDGHPSISPDGRWMLTDTYPSRSRMSSLLVFDLAHNSLHTIGRFFSPLSFHGENRCDLHPRWSDDGSRISFDSTHEGIRQMYTINFSPESFLEHSA